MLDDGEHEPLTMEQRAAADRAMRARDGVRGAGRLGRSPSPGASSDAGTEFSALSPDGQQRRKRRRTEGSPDGRRFGPLPGDEDDVPQAFYDLTSEKLEQGQELSGRLIEKIR